MLTGREQTNGAEVECGAVSNKGGDMIGPLRLFPHGDTMQLAENRSCEVQGCYHSVRVTFGSS